MTEDLEIRFHTIDYCPWLNAIIYFSALLYADVSVWRAIVVTAVIVIATIFNYGRRTFTRIGMVIAFAGLAVWAGVLPEPGKWPELARSGLGCRQVSPGL